jgi:hypothetical protein
MPLGTPTLTVETNSAGYTVLVLSCSGATAGTIRRVTPAGSIKVRGATDVSMVSGAFYVSDYEIPQSYELAYWGEVTDGTTTKTTQVITAPGLNRGVDWIAPLGEPLNGMEVNVETVGDLMYETTSDKAFILNRRDPVVITWGRHMPATTIALVTLTDEQRIGLQAVLSSARIVLFQPRIGYGFEEPLFLSIGNVKEFRPAALGREQARRWELDCQLTGPPPPQFTINLGDSWQDILDAGDDWTHYLQAGGTWFDLTGV